MKMPNDELAESIRCPICFSSIDCSDIPICSNAGCEGSSGFMVSAGCPVLIDFSNSIFRPDDYRNASMVQPSEGSRLGRFLRRLTYSDNSRTPRFYARFVDELGTGARVLVVGGGTQGAGSACLYKSELKLVSTDVYPSPEVNLICDGHSLPFADETFDGVVIQAVLEHVLDPQKVVAEIRRVLKPRGLVYACTPFMQQVHMAAYDFTRFTHSGHRWLFRDFEEIQSDFAGGPATVLLWSLSYYLRSFGLGKKVVAAVTACFFWVRLLERFMKTGASLDAASGNQIIARKALTSLRPADMVEYYAASRAGK